MKLLTYKSGKADALGVLAANEKEIYPLAALGYDFKDMNDLIERITDQQMEALRAAIQEPCAAALKLEDTELCSPIPHPKHDVICLGLNYVSHGEEAARIKKGEVWTGKRTTPVYFVKRMYDTTAPIGTASDFSNINQTIGYGVELGVIMGKEAKNVPVEKAMEYVFGYTIINDLTARELGPRHHGPFMSKSPDGYMPMGPWIVTKDEFDHNPTPRLGVRARVNGDLRQGSTTERVTFLPDYLIADLTKVMTLRAGTVISTGSPGEGELGYMVPKFLYAGDTVRCEIDGIGSITTTIVSAKKRKDG